MRWLFAITLVAVLAATSDAKRPNILYLYVDDMGWGAIGPNGQSARRDAGKPSVRTPHLDALARAGLNFTRGYGCHVCSPARSSQQSGFHQGHTFADRNDPDNAKKAMRSDDVLMGDALSRAGYVTGYWGKWGYGGSKDQQSPKLDNLQTLPTSHGYQHVLAELHHVRAHTFFQPTLWHAPAPSGSRGGLHLIPNSMSRYQADNAFPNEPALQNHSEYPATGYCDDAYAFAALEFIREGGQRYNKDGTPFFGLLAVQIPHAPFGEIEQLPQWDRAYAGDPHFESLSPQTRQWMAMVTRIDAHFGNLFSALEDPNNDGDRSDSIAENTLVVFQSDNGGPAGKNNVELDANGGLRGNKGSIYEGGIRVPLVMRWPAMIHGKSKLKAGTNCDKVVDVTDLLPTFCELAGAPVPLGIDGVSIAPTLAGKGYQRERQFLIHEAGRGQSSIILGNDKLVYSEKRPPELFDLLEDRTESNNIAASHPDKVRRLTELILGERVTEPKGFANTYHRWAGTDQGQTSSADNWSDYVYENNGVTYMRDAGAPQLSWVAKMWNESAEEKTAFVDENLELLALEIRGTKASQRLKLSPGVHLSGRNEIRLGANSRLELNGGKAISLRWVEIQEGAVLSGDGVVEADVFNQGKITGKVRIDGEMRQGPNGELVASLSSNDDSLTVSGPVTLDGTLTVSSLRGHAPRHGEAWTVIRAGAVSGRFKNSDVVHEGQRFEIGYGENVVTLTAVR
ncbi:MAG: sulfatase-like hydrolase/transferase [Planctomycetota bacterium]